MADVNKNNLVTFNGPELPPSKQMANAILGNLLTDQKALVGEPENILNRYNDFDYSPTQREIETWIKDDTQKSIEEFHSGDKKNDGQSEAFIEGLSASFNTLLDNYSNGHVSEEELVETTSQLFSWMDSSPFWGGSPLDPYWHATQAQSALLQIGNRSVEIIDTLYDVFSLYITTTMDLVSQTSEEQIAMEDEIIQNITSELESTQKKISAAIRKNKEIVQLAMKIGFMYRDSWWLNKHGDAAIRGYIAKATATKAGRGGTLASSKARRNRILKFLEVHAELIRHNPALRIDTDSEVAVRAIKIARKEYPEDFKRGFSKKSAIDYWEYIKSDKELWKNYCEKLISTKPL